MSKSVLFVCQSCQISRPKPPDRPSDGAILCDRLLSLYQEWSQRSELETELEIRPVRCLWFCSSPCVIAFSAPDKATYLFTKVPATEAEALLQFGQLYVASKDGDIPWKQFPEVLQSTEIAKIPSLLL